MTGGSSGIGRGIAGDLSTRDGIRALADAAVEPFGDFAGASVFLAGAGSAYVTGHSLFVDGGMSSH